MRHHNQNRKFGRETNERRALLRGLALSLIDKGRIRTTEAKAKELRPFIERLITKARENTLSSRRSVTSTLGNVEGGRKLVNEISLKYKERSGGYTRIVKLEPRKSDGAKMAVIEFI
ncbi:MAG TPA: 50S ribosomal protein L17 [Candidatus Paceibacterota bacterium]|nr:50S ribosomal protein L17 [Candidatus Paceibacterota bacterium]